VASFAIPPVPERTNGVKRHAQLLSSVAHRHTSSFNVVFGIRWTGWIVGERVMGIKHVNIGSFKLT